MLSALKYVERLQSIETGLQEIAYEEEEEATEDAESEESDEDSDDDTAGELLFNYVQVLRKKSQEKEPLGIIHLALSYTLLMCLCIFNMSSKIMIATLHVAHFLFETSCM